MANETKAGTSWSWDLFACLLEAATRAEPVQAANILVTALGDKTHSLTRRDLAHTLAKVAARMEPTQGAKVCVQAADILVAALSEKTDATARQNLAWGLADVAARMESVQAAQVCNRAADVLVTDLGKQIRPDFHVSLADGLSAVAECMETAQAAKVCAQAANILIADLGKNLEPSMYRRLASTLSKVAARMESAQGAKVCAQTADILVAALGEKTDSTARQNLAWGLEDVAARMEPTEGAKLRARATGILTELGEDNAVDFRKVLAQDLVAEAIRLEPARAASFLLAAWGESRAVARGDLARGLLAIATGAANQEQKRAQLATILAAGTFGTPYGLLPSLPLLHPHFHPQPRPLPPQTLVELLKHPFCVGEARRAVLDALEFTYSRKFKDQWEFVEYAQKYQPQLDLLTPPTRPERP